MTPHLADRFDPAVPTHVAAARSWLALRPRVMAWLWYLNAIYWVAFFHLERPEAGWIAAAYLAVGPLIALMLWLQRGLTRLSGLIHLPWVPLVVWLGWRLYGDAAGLTSEGGTLYGAWLHLLFGSTCLCLALDAIDVARWLRGERYVLGTPAAHAAGASRRTMAPVGPER